MELKDVIKQLNELYHKSQRTVLTTSELEERDRLRRVYLDAIKGQVKANLDQVKISDETDNHGTDQGEGHTCNDHCGCGHKH